MTSLDEPIRIHLFWDCEIRYDGGSPYFDGPSKKTWVLRRHISHVKLFNKICNFKGFDSSSVMLTFLFQCPVLVQGSTTVQYYGIGLHDDDDMDNLWSLPSEFKTASVYIYVQFDHITLTSIMPLHPIVNDDSVINVQSNHGSFTSLLMNEGQDFTFKVPSHTLVSRSTSTMIGASTSGMFVSLVPTEGDPTDNTMDHNITELVA